MATINANGNFPTELVTDMFNAVTGHSTLAKLSDRKPMPFSGVTEFVFSAEDEASLVLEGNAKPANSASATPVIIKPLKFVYQQRVSDEFVKCSDEKRLTYLETFADGFARKIARGFDIAAMHGIDPKTSTAVSDLSGNNFDDLVNSISFDTSSDVLSEKIEYAISQMPDIAVTGIAFAPSAAAALSTEKENGVTQFPEFRMGQNPDAFYGMKSDVNSTVIQRATGDTDHTIVYVGDFANAFKWGYVEEIPFEVIRYGDPDGAGRDLKRYNEVCLRSEAYIGWGILDVPAFRMIVISN